MFIGLQKATISRFFLLYLCEFVTFSNYFPLFGTINQINDFQDEEFNRFSNKYGNFALRL